MFENLRAGWSRLARPMGLALTLVGVLQLRAPERLLSTAGKGCDLLLDGEFEPREGSERRVKLVGVLLVAAGLHLLYWGGVLPRKS
ncbi:hypothetical protein [Haloarchaeobius sp. TZWWS8]|uniref:hypothetical protein n=1 Tax=Haloarchaeobius sp. TZWWS8 TaxID=3446121 RepID=UPI003EB94A68